MREEIVSKIRSGAGQRELSRECGISRYATQSWLTIRQFQADRPNSKQFTDISYICNKEGVLYLSMARNQYDNSIVTYKTGTRQTVNLILDSIQLAMKKEERESLRCYFLHCHVDVADILVALFI